LEIKSIYPVSFRGYGAANACYLIVNSMATDKVSTYLFGLSVYNHKDFPSLKTLFPHCLNRFIYKFISESILINLVELYFYININRGDLAYVWPGTSIKLLEKLKQKGCLIVGENINCHRATSAKLLDLEYNLLGLVTDHSITAEKIEEEVTKSAYYHYIFSPSDCVKESLLLNGIGPEKILETSYGLTSKEQLDISSKKYSNTKPIVAIFVGRVDVRKGVHLLLEYWDKADVNGVLKIVGGIEQPVENIVADYYDHPKIEFIDFVDDLKSLYAEADMFILPSIEEGSPLVTYLALGAGLPCIVSPMGGGGIINDQIEGFVIEPHDKKSWVSAIRKLSSDASLRKKQSLAARELSDHYLWNKVGARRVEMLMEKIEGKES